MSDILVYRAETKTTVEPVVVGVQCNVCGKTRTVEEHGKYEFHEDMHAIGLGGGWGDQFPGDLEHIEFVACGDCLKAWADTFKVPVTSTHTMRRDRGTYPVTHSETGEAWLCDEIYAYPANAPFKVPDGIVPEVCGEFPCLGVFEHFKGEKYEVLDHVWASEPLHEILVVYRALYGDSKTFVRPVQMWGEMVPKPGHEGEMVPRFRYVG